MKKFFLPLFVSCLLYQESSACAWYDPDYEYFNLFTQSIIRDKSYTPFLLSYSEAFYSDNKIVLPDDNIEAWRKYFNNQLSYQQTDQLVKHISLNDLNALKKGTPTHPLLVQLGNSFYAKYTEAIDYLIEAKYLEPYMRINFIENENSFYYYRDESQKNATNLDYEKTIAALTKLYNHTKDKEIKLRYGYQLVRFNHYTRHYNEAVEAFKQYVAPLKLKGAPYYLALDQYAGALRGLNKKDEANWNFFQVFKNTKFRKADAYSSIKLSDSMAFKNLLNRAQTKEDKISAYFLLGYQDFNNPLDIMQKIYDIDPNSEALKVLAARAINELERHYLLTYYSSSESDNPTLNTTSDSTSPSKEKSSVANEENISFWDRIVNFFKRLFGSSTGEKDSVRSNDLSDKTYLNHPDRIPFLAQDEYRENSITETYVENLEKLVEKTAGKSDDEFWKISEAYIKFLQKDYKVSTKILSEINTNNKDYQEQIARMSMLNEIVAQPKITPEFEELLMTKYASYFVKDTTPNENKDSEVDVWEPQQPSTKEFLQDVIANRYYIQGEDAKSFLMSNSLSDLRYYPDLELTKKLEAFYNKKDKTKFEQEILVKNMQDVGDVPSFFAVIYGDHAMRNNKFSEAVQHYQKVKNLAVFTSTKDRYDYNTGETIPIDWNTEYDGFRNISDYVFGHNIMESFQSPVNETMRKEDFAKEFSFIQPRMNKLQLAQAAVELSKIGQGKDIQASYANQLLGNLLYNTSILGYFREVFVMDLTNGNGGKFHFDEAQPRFHYYFKNYSYYNYITPENFDHCLDYYKAALAKTNQAEQKARILFQMASAEQGKYYQYEATRTKDWDYSDPDWSKKMEAHELELSRTKNNKYRTYFAELKKNYNQTKTSTELMGRCSYYHYFMTK